MLFLRNSLYLITALLFLILLFRLLSFGSAIKKGASKEFIQTKDAIIMMDKYLRSMIPLVVFALILLIVAAFIDGVLIR